MNKLTEPIAITAFVVGSILFLLYQANYNNGTNLVSQMTTACEAHQDNCQSLISKVQEDGNYEVVSDGHGRYWAEMK